MLFFISKETHLHTGDDDPYPSRVSFIFETYTGIGPLLIVQENRGLLSPAKARDKLRELHRSNLKYAWLAGIPGLFPLISWFSYLQQLGPITGQERTGEVLEFPKDESREETFKNVVVFIGIIAIFMLALLVWKWIDPDGLARFADEVGKRK